MNTSIIRKIEHFIRLANKDEYSLKHASKLIDKMGGINIVQIDFLITNLEYINGIKKENYED